MTYSYTESDWKDLLTAVDGREITYDAIGNPLTYGGTFSGSWQFTWKNGRQLATASRYSSNISYNYDADGMRTGKNVDGAISEYVYLGGKLIEETRGSNVKLQFSYDEQGHTEAEYVYDAWGNLEYSFDVNGIGTLNPLRYRGYYYDSETGFYYVSSRYYDPGIGRFISADGQIAGVGGEINGYNLYSYCQNNPVNMSDPDGNWPKWATKVLVGAAVIAAAAIVTVATGGASGTLVAAVHCVAVGALKGAVVGAAVGAVTGAASSAVKHRVTTGSWKGAGSAAVEGGATGFMTGAITGAITGGKNSNVCFVAGTSILTSIGYVLIEDISEGDKVWSENPETGEKELKEVVQTFVNETDELVHVHVNGEEIVTTPEHPFYVPKKGWGGALDLRAGDILVLQSGEYVVVELIQHEILESPVTVYNFEVEDFHTYYVGTNGISVHNMCEKVTSPNQMQKQVLRGQAPKDVIRVDNPKIPGQKPHIHFKDGTALNIDGTIHDAKNGIPSLSNEVRIWLFDNGWKGN